MFTAALPLEAASASEAWSMAAAVVGIRARSGALCALVTTRIDEALAAPAPGPRSG